MMPQGYQYPVPYSQIPVAYPTAYPGYSQVPMYNQMMPNQAP
jgi:hypothetical protein